MQMCTDGGLEPQTTESLDFQQVKSHLQQRLYSLCFPILLNFKNIIYRKMWS